MLEVQPSGWESPIWKPVYSFPCDAAETDDIEPQHPGCLGPPPPSSSATEPSSGFNSTYFDSPLTRGEPVAASCSTAFDHHQLPGFCLVLTTHSSLEPICTLEASLCPAAAAYIAAASPPGPSTPPRPDTSPARHPLASYHSVPLPDPAPLHHRPRAAATGPPGALLFKRPRSPASPASSLKRPISPAHSSMHIHRPPALLIRRSSPAATPHPHPTPTPTNPTPSLPPISTTSASAPDTSPASHPSCSPPTTPPATCPAPTTPTHPPHNDPHPSDLPSTSTPGDPPTNTPGNAPPPHHDHNHLASTSGALTPTRAITHPAPLDPPSASYPTAPHYLDTSSRILLCVPDALLKEVVKVPLATAADKFLYSVVPSSPDVLPVYSLGAGAFGTVKLVYVETPAPAQELRMCAVKSVVPSPTYSQGDFWKEVEVMEACRGCPFVLHMFSAHVADGVCHLLMEVAGNGCLRDLLWAASLYDEAGLPVRGFSEEAARYLVAGLLVALQHLHALDIAHLDIKPENVLLDADLRAKLADFGVTRCLRGQPTPTDIVGTPGYQPPEMLNGHGFGVAADMWACGMVAYQLVAGDLPEEWVLDLLLKKGIFRPPAGLSQDLEDLLLQLLAVDPTRRLTAAQARAHPWFDGFDWAAFQDGTMPRPSIPIYHRLPDQRPDSMDPAAGPQQA